MKITTDSLADMELQLSWESADAHHADYYFGRNVNFWRDIFPEEMYAQAMDKGSGDRLDFIWPAGKALPDHENGKSFRLWKRQFTGKTAEGSALRPAAGRFYPKGVLSGVSGVFKANVEPFRCIDVSDAQLTVDFNHPLSGKDLTVSALVHDVREKKQERGGTAVDWIETLTEGPGIQARWNGRATDFFSDDPFRRDDEAPDGAFYAKPRFVSHIDAAAVHNISSLYGRYLSPGMDVLDLMSSWESHIPGGLELNSLVGLGLNAEELAANPMLSAYDVRDLNETPELPYDDNQFDSALCTASVEYLVKPFAVFREVSRVVKPGGRFVATFSNRWFPPKAIRIWRELHEFERMGLVMEYFLESGLYEDIRTCSMRGTPRPVTDKYFPELPASDPVFCVSGAVK